MSQIDGDYESRVYLDPDGVDVDQMFEYLWNGDPHTRYEAAAGAFALADRRPERLSDRVDELLELLDGEWDRTVGSGTGRGWIAEVIAQVIPVTEHDVARGLTERLDGTEDDRRRALLVLKNLPRVAGELPQPVIQVVAGLGPFLDSDDSRVASRAAYALCGIVDADPEAVAAQRDRLVALLETDSSRASSECLSVLAMERPDLVAPSAPAIVDRLETIPAQSIEAVFLVRAVEALANARPDAVRGARPRLEELRALTDSRVPDRVIADALAAIDETDPS